MEDIEPIEYNRLYTGIDDEKGTASWEPLWGHFKKEAKQPNIVILETKQVGRELIEIRGVGKNIIESMADFHFSFGSAALWVKKNVKIHTNIRDHVEGLTKEDIRFHCYIRVSYDK